MPVSGESNNVSPESQSKVLTVGEQRVRVNFNTNNDEAVGHLKVKAAELIDICETLKSSDPRLASLAQTSFEEGAMWAVKAATSFKK